MKSLFIKRGLHCNFDGEPAHELGTMEKPSQVAVLPYMFPDIKPRMHIKTGDRVKIGSVLYEDKRRPDIKFRSPGGGVVSRIVEGARRVIKEVVIDLDAEEERHEFSSLNSNHINQMSRQQLVQAITNSGLWSLIKSLPFRRMADPDVKPPAIIITLNGAEPFQPQPEIYLQDSLDLFRFGVKVMQQLAPSVYVASSGNDATVLGWLNNYITHTVSGHYPAGDPAVFLYYIKQSADENRAWYIDGQDLLLIARFFSAGEYPVTRVIASGGHLQPHPRHLKIRSGAPIAQIVGDIYAPEKIRVIVGGVFSGYAASLEDFMGLGDSAVTILPEGKEKTLFGFVRPGYTQPSRSRTFLSFFNKNRLAYDCSLHGEPRACINCGYCAGICPVDILPQFTMKCLKADEIEEALMHGLLDCAECGACTYVCPAKIDLSQTLTSAKAAYNKELNG